MHPQQMKNIVDLRPRRACAETDEAMETGGGLASLGRHSDAGTRKDPAWKHALRSFILYVASLLCLLVLDAIWMKGIAPALGVDYFAVVKVSTASLVMTYLRHCEPTLHTLPVLHPKFLHAVSLLPDTAIDETMSDQVCEEA